MRNLVAILFLLVSLLLLAGCSDKPAETPTAAASPTLKLTVPPRQ